MSRTNTVTHQDTMVDLEMQPCTSRAETAITSIYTDSRATTAVSADTETESKEPPTISLKEAEAEAAALAQREINHNITEPLQNYQRGYPLLAAFQSSESSFSIYRSFDYLHSRVILDLQDELRHLEEGLSELDKRDYAQPERRKCVTSRSHDLKAAKRKGLTCSERSTLLGTIREKLVNYDEIMIKMRELNAFQRPSKRDYRSLRTWFYNIKPLGHQSEGLFVKRKEDLITLRHGREWAGFDGWIEDCVRKLPKTWSRWLFTTPEQREKTDDKNILFYSPARIERLVGLIITFIIFILLVLPVVAMYKLTSVGDRNSTFDAVGILVVFTLLFSAAMSLLTKAKRHELFAASAAYCAVLVVFISNFGNDGTSFGGGRAG
ncbi:hypothetical protein B5807_07301 [Epicoccum nigrum]|uniref:DUF6594 domain-containing protein n=1 Tax=Epicoccum nigrum TaxID=105696 RepID=A0A1Y2LV79_EPING|nr:hypothetical protein B5807_07301 [Epicoccum nigrum]